MKRMIAIALALGTVSPALAQSDTGLFFEAPAVLLPAQPSITVHLWAEFPAADYAFASAQFDVLASEPGWSDPTLLWMGPVVTTPGAIRGADVLGVYVWQLHFPSGVLADPTNPIEVWKAQFTITDFAPRTIQLSTVTEMFRVYPGEGSSESELRASHEAFGEIRVIPAPGALGLLGLGGGCAMRRRARASQVAGAGLDKGRRIRLRPRLCAGAFRWGRGSGRALALSPDPRCP